LKLMIDDLLSLKPQRQIFNSSQIVTNFPVDSISTIFVIAYL
jgi:hypothetical protein